MDCLGVPEAPVINKVTDENNQRVLLVTSPTEICGDDDIFRRGDSDGDGIFDISDPIAILGCLFLGTECSECPDAADANDDGEVNIADASFLLNWRFNGGAQPSRPFPACGIDRVEDALGDCVFDSGACE